MRALLTLLTLSFLFIPTPGKAASLRCDRELASEGSSKAEVLLKCGEPTFKETRTVAVGEKKHHGRAHRPYQTDDSDDDTTTTQVVYKTLDEWTYNYGPHRLMQVAVFENGVLVDVRSAGYGR